MNNLDYLFQYFICIDFIIGSYKRGSVGYSMNGIEVKIHEPDENGDGEICFRGRHVFMGYLNQEEKTREAIDEDGWLHSGDIGRVDGDGMYLYMCLLLMFVFVCAFVVNVCANRLFLHYWTIQGNHHY